MVRSAQRGWLRSVECSRPYPLRYTVHSPDQLNLADEGDPDTNAKALRSTIDFASEIGAGVVVYHGSARSGIANSAGGRQRYWRHARMAATTAGGRGLASGTRPFPG